MITLANQCMAQMRKSKYSRVKIEVAVGSS